MELETMLLNVWHALGCDSIVVKQASDRELKTAVETALVLGQQLLIRDVTPRLYQTVYN